MPFIPYEGRSYEGIGKGIREAVGFFSEAIEKKREEEKAQQMFEGLDFKKPEDFFEAGRRAISKGDYSMASKLFDYGVTREYYQGKNVADALKGVKGSDIGQMSESTRTSIQNQLRETFQTTFDFGETNPENLPGGVSEAAAIDEIFAIHQSRNISIPNAIKLFTAEYGQAAGLSPKNGPPIYKRPE